MPHKDPEARRRYLREWAAKNKDKVRAKERTRREKGGEARKAVVRAASLKWRWRAAGIPEPTRPIPEWCECCGKLLLKTPHNDHNHRTGKFRGWICFHCNAALGMLQADFGTAGLEKAIAYLRRAE